MSIFDLHTPETAPEGSRETMKAVSESMGFLPNLYGVFAESPSVIKAYTAITQLLNRSSFNIEEQQLMLLTISAANGCEYCVAAHTMVGKMVQLDDTIIEAIRTGVPIPDAKLARLNAFTKSVVENRGWVSAEEIDAFIDAGFTKAQVLEVVLAVSLKTLSNYVNHFSETPLDDVLEPLAWHAPNPRAA